MNNKIEHLIWKYREFLFRIHRKPLKGILSPGATCNIEDPSSNITHGDIVHPCIRFIPEGFEGHQWWMTYTPFYGKIDGIENPRLCYADANDGKAPTTWYFYCTIKEKPKKGYNSDPTMLFHDNKIFVFWRESETENAEKFGYNKATFGCYVQQKKITYFNEPTLGEEAVQTDHELCPTVIESNGKYFAYAVHIRFNPQWISFIPDKLMRLIYKYNIIEYTYMLFGASRKKIFGISKWEGNALDKTFLYFKTIPFKKISRLHHPWHIDLFEANDQNDKNSLFAVVQTDERLADIYLAKLKGDHFQFYSLPLVTRKSIGMIGIYKPSAVVIDNTFYLYYTARDNNDTMLNRMFVTSTSWKDLLNRLEG